MSDIGFGPVGDPPIIYDTSTTDGYGRVTRLVDRRLLEQAQARIAELERELRPNSPLRQQADTYHRILRHPEIYRHTRECGKSMSDQIMQRIDALAAERDHWRAEAEKARTPDASNPAHLRFAADVLIGAPMSASVADWLRAEADRLESESTTDDVEYPETLAVAKMIYENLPSEDPGGGVEPWDELTDEQRAPFLMNARNLGHVFPEEYPKLAAELARYRAAATADDVVEKVELRANHSSWCPLHQDLTPHSGDQGLPCFDAVGLLRGER
ncbi:hypothetical protein SEA_KENNA_76 [Gordonia phage Kenna]|uniref:Uncharacterized protein n=2 Tax=Getalongvirus kenna TaxID=2734201 RepID=A0A3S9UQ01_9CAUD|nr:hypothetical protein HOU97_gp76 [Gordonia phage Kenna]AZS12352.1 hypothetical protein SEA_KENNA_76 [Gordonia phage Kenna]QCG77239.1 hypothetical protein SEA_LUTUM_82 [Gordonia phage Lutum]